MADVGEQNPLTAMLEQALDAWVRQLSFTLPGAVATFDPTTQLAQVQPGIQKVTGEGDSVTMPVIEDVPVVFPGSGSWFLFHEVVEGTEGLLHFSQRAIDTWIDQGGPVAPHELRVLSAEDAVFAPGVRSQPNAIPSFRNDGAGIANADDDTYVHLKGDKTVELAASGLVIKGDVTVEGEVTASGQINSDTELSVGTLAYTTHIHGGVASGDKTTGTPQ